jgi:hypothetical protein
LAGELDKPGMGIMFMDKLDRIATYIPDEVLAEAAAPKAKPKPKAKAKAKAKIVPKKRKTATRRPAKKASK